MCRLDIPKAPLLLGQLLGSAIDEGSLKGASLQEVCEPIEDTEARRELLAHVLKTVQASHKSMKQECYIASAICNLCRFSDGFPAILMLVLQTTWGFVPCCTCITHQ